MGKRRPSGDGMVRKRPDGRWEGRIVVGHKADGSSIFRYLYADTQKELTTKLRKSDSIFLYSTALCYPILTVLPHNHLHCFY